MKVYELIHELLKLDQSVLVMTSHFNGWFDDINHIFEEKYVCLDINQTKDFEWAHHAMSRDFMEAHPELKIVKAYII